MTAEVKPLIEEFEALPESAKREVLTMGVIKIAALSMVIMAIAIPTSAAICSQCDTARYQITGGFSVGIEDPTAAWYTIAVCNPSNKGKIPDCEVVDVDQYTQACKSTQRVRWDAPT